MSPWENDKEKKMRNSSLNNYSFGRIGQEMLMEEDYADDEIETELAPIVVQLAYVRQVTVSSYIFH